MMKYAALVAVCAVSLTWPGAQASTPADCLPAVFSLVGSLLDLLLQLVGSSEPQRSGSRQSTSTQSVYSPQVSYNAVLGCIRGCYGSDYSPDRQNYCRDQVCLPCAEETVCLDDECFKDCRQYSKDICDSRQSDKQCADQYCAYVAREKARADAEAQAEAVAATEPDCFTDLDDI
ncbi:hypothetical protein HDE_01532 [Halotydeus destructor]|nr:hypothetical protein HDE_01532 [Halotydeus destructor]